MDFNIVPPIKYMDEGSEFQYIIESIIGDRKNKYNYETLRHSQSKFPRQDPSLLVYLFTLYKLCINF